MPKETGPRSLFKKGVAPRDENGSFNPAAVDTVVLAEDFGLRMAEGAQEVINKHDGSKATIVELLAKCAYVAIPIYEAKKEDGFEGVKDTIALFQRLDRNFKVDISEETERMNREGTLLETVKAEAAAEAKKKSSRSQTTQLFPPMNL